MKKLSYKLFLLLLFFGCSSENIFLSFKDTPDGWQHKNSIEFDFNAPNEAVNISLLLRVDKSYPFSNIFVVYKIINHEKIISDTLDLYLNKEEKDVFSKNSLSLNNHIFSIAENIILNDSNVKVEFKHATRFINNKKAEEKLAGILSVGLLVENFENEKIYISNIHFLVYFFVWDNCHVLGFLFGFNR